MTITQTKFAIMSKETGKLWGGGCYGVWEDLGSCKLYGSAAAAKCGISQAVKGVSWRGTIEDQKKFRDNMKIVTVVVHTQLKMNEGEE